MNVELARGRVECLVRLARRIQDERDEIGQEARQRLPEVTGLTQASIELALSQHFETEPTAEELDKLIKSVTSAPVCHVIMSANVFTAPLRALALAVATSPRVFVRASRRDPVMTDLLIRMLASDRQFAAFDGVIDMHEKLHVGPGHELHIYGSDESIAAIVNGLPAGVLVRAHGTGIGLAIVGENIDLIAAAEALAQDVGVFDQRGCLSPRFVFVEGGEDRAERFCVELEKTMWDFSFCFGGGVLDAGLQAEIARYQATMEAIGSYWQGSSYAVGFDPAPRALLLPPAARIAHVVPANVANMDNLLDPWIRYVTAIGLDGESGLSRMLKEKVPWARWSRLGFMQRPPLDGPVDGRT
ncbi:MAG TPA: acyl-CoA reductase, partial [Polyangium sp.]|nr:acyl-CoA reductase [Polyangium sp.]